MAPILTGTQTDCAYKHKVKNNTKNLQLRHPCCVKSKQKKVGKVKTQL